MKRWLISLLVLPVLVAGAAPGNAATPGIRSTKEYQQLKVYVQQLEAKKSQPQTPAEIAKYRSELSQKRAKTSAKVRALYQDQLNKAKQRRDNRKAKVVRLKQRKQAALANLRQAEQARLNAIGADRRAALARINTRYSSKMDNLTKQRAQLQKKIAKAKNPIKRQNLREEQQAVQDQINALVKSKQDDIRIANNKYDDQVETTKENYSRQHHAAVQPEHHRTAAEPARAVPDGQAERPAAAGDSVRRREGALLPRGGCNRRHAAVVAVGEHVPAWQVKWQSVSTLGIR